MAPVRTLRSGGTAASEAGFTPVKRAGGLGGAPLAPPSSTRTGRPRHYPVLVLQPLEGGDAHGPADVVVGGTVPGAVLHELRPLHEAVAVDDQLLAAGAHEVVLAAHEDRFLRAGVDAEAAIDAPEEVDLEPRGVLLDRRFGPLPGLDVDAFG